jgi:hypothetical protein
MSTPNVENYTLGRGMLYWDPWDATNLRYEGERALGNAPEISINMNATFLDHYSSMSGFKSKDKTVVNELAPQITFALDELVSDNWQMLVFGNKSTVTQSADDSNTLAIASPLKDRYYDLGFRAIASTRITHGTVTSGPFQVGETITGATSKKTAVIVEVKSGYLIVNTVSGAFTGSPTFETIEGGTSKATATTTSEAVAVSGLVSLKTTTGSTYYTATTDFTVDAVSGRIYFPSTSTIVPATSLTVNFGVAATTYDKITALTAVGQDGKIRYVSDNPVGGANEMIIWKVRIKPNGDTALIGDDWARLPFQGDILRDATYHPTSPYMDMIVVDPT